MFSEKKIEEIVELLSSKNRTSLKTKLYDEVVVCGEVGVYLCNIDMHIRRKLSANISYPCEVTFFLQGKGDFTLTLEEVKDLIEKFQTIRTYKDLLEKYYDDDNSLVLNKEEFYKRRSEIKTLAFKEIIKRIVDE